MSVFSLLVDVILFAMFWLSHRLVPHHHAYTVPAAHLTVMLMLTPVLYMGALLHNFLVLSLSTAV